MAPTVAEPSSWVEQKERQARRFVRTNDADQVSLR
jgi:hypothetical protein